jgi:hypothetical protein
MAAVELGRGWCGPHQQPRLFCCQEPPSPCLPACLDCLPVLLCPGKPSHCSLSLIIPTIPSLPFKLHREQEVDGHHQRVPRKHKVYAGVPPGPQRAGLC